ncbi:hypothetical protein I7I53_04222 [Histoplasma capsulatum var. duboisii H88]|uniref:Uncharacterized protein n=1 Tax=Ajellomyces capsulatus (strain H88) TaxID=544711 RepID=A0A8A1LUK8_AJEC8|nr:hypothetical protein I7I53_04222 [Histoplasma capsulatum var. duboisii H88]
MPRQRSLSSLPHLEDSKEIGHSFSTTRDWSWQRIVCLWDGRQNWFAGAGSKMVCVLKSTGSC